MAKTNPYSKRTAAARAALKQRKLDGLIVTKPANVRYLSGYSGSSGLLWLVRRESLLLTDFRYQEQCKREVRGSRTVIIKKSLFEDLLAVPSFAKARTVGFESPALAFAQYAFLKKRARTKRYVATEKIVEAIRLIKGSGELAKVARAAAIADRAFAAIVKRIRPGMTEEDVAAQLDGLMKHFGSSKPSFDTIVASGQNSALPHAQPGSRKLRRGDFLTMDFGATYQGYHSDMTRTVCIGRPTPKHRQIYNLVLEAQLKGLRAVRHGTRGADADAAAREVIEQAGYGSCFGHGLGHGVGLEVHEGPGLRKLSEDVLKTGQVVTVEPGVYLPGWGGVRIEDLVVVTRSGCRILSRSPKKLTVIP
jgi:Xaa-Pro aminopeptidase